MNFSKIINTADNVGDFKFFHTLAHCNIHLYSANIHSSSQFAVASAYLRWDDVDENDAAAMVVASFRNEL